MFRREGENADMVVIANGKEMMVDEKTTIAEFLERSGYRQDRVVIEKNGEVIPRRFYETEYLSDKDEIEIVHFVGGG